MVPAKLSADFKPTISEVDFKYNIKPSFLLNIFQIIAGEHAGLLNSSYDVMKNEYNAYWVLSRIYVEIDKYPDYNSILTVETWPLKPDTAQCIRNYIVKDPEGNIICRGKSMWLILDYIKHTIRAVKTIGLYSPDNFEDDILREHNLGKIFSEESNHIYNYEVRLSDIDINHHVNNAKYGDYMFNAFTGEEFENKNIKSFQINYISETKEGDLLSIYKKQKDDKSYLIEGKAGSKTAFISKIVLD